MSDLFEFSWSDRLGRAAKWVVCMIAAAAVGIGLSYVFIPAGAYGNVKGTDPVVETMTLVPEDTCTYQAVKYSATMSGLIVSEIWIDRELFPIADSQCIQIQQFESTQPELYRALMRQWAGHMVACIQSGKCYIKVFPKAGDKQGVDRLDA